MISARIKQPENTKPCAIVSFAAGNSGVVIGVILVLTVIFGYFATRIQIDTEILRLLPEDHEANLLIEKYQDETKDIEYLFLVAISEDLFALEKLELFQEAIEHIESIDGVAGSFTPFNLPDFRRSGFQVTFDSLAKEGKAPEDEAALQAFRKRITDSPLARNLVLSDDETGMCAIFEIQVIEDYSGLLSRVENIIAPMEGDFEFHVAGWIPLHDATQKHILKDSPRLILIAIGIIFLVFLVSFGTIRALYLPLLAVSIGMIWTVGIMSMVGIPLSIVGIMTPVLIMALGSSYSVHTLNQYYHDAEDTSAGREWLVHSLCRISRTIVSASVTTAIGFASLLAATIVRIRQFGVSTAVGVLVCAVLTLFLFPAVLVRLRAPNASSVRRATTKYLASRMRLLGLYVRKLRFVALVLFVGIIVVFTISLQHVKYETDYTSYFRKTVPALDDNRALMEKFGGFMYLNLTLAAPDDEPGYFLDYDHLESIARFEDELLKSPDITHVTSFTSYLKAMNHALFGVYEFPQNQTVISSLSRVFESNGSIIEDYQDLLFVNDSFTRLTLQIRMYDSDTKWFLFEEKLSEVVSYISTHASRLLPTETNPELWGWNLVALELSRILAKDQVISILVSAGLVFLVAAITFRSVVFGAFCLVPLALGVMVNFIAMWSLRIPFDVLTTMFSSVAIGAGIDDAIHLLIQYRRFARIYPDSRQLAISHAVGLAGRPIVLTSIAVITGLCALAFSSFWPVVYFGMLVSMALFSTTVGALLFLPAFLSFDPRASSRKRRV